MSATISLLVFNFNQAQYLPDCLEAISRQSRKPDEILITDDASSDQSIEILTEFQRTNPNVQLILNQKNLGLHGSLNQAVDQAKGDYMTFLPADDILLPLALENWFRFLHRHPRVSLICSDLILFEDRQEPLYELYQFLPHSKELVLAPEEMVSLLRKTRFWIASHGCLYHRELFKKYGGYKRELRTLSDYYINYQLALRHPSGYIPAPSQAVRVVAQSYGNTTGKNFKKRYALTKELLALVTQKEDPAFRKAFHQSRVLSFNGLFMALYLMIHPRHWHLLPPLLAKIGPSLGKKILLKILRKKIPVISFPPSRILRSRAALDAFAAQRNP